MTYNQEVQRLILKMFYEEHYSVTEIDEQLKLNPGTARFAIVGAWAKDTEENSPKRVKSNETL